MQLSHGRHVFSIKVPNRACKLRGSLTHFQLQSMQNLTSNQKLAAVAVTFAVGWAVFAYAKKPKDRVLVVWWTAHVWSCFACMFDYQSSRFQLQRDSASKPTFAELAMMPLKMSSNVLTRA